MSFITIKAGRKEGKRREEEEEGRQKRRKDVWKRRWEGGKRWPKKEGKDDVKGRKLKPTLATDWL